MSMEDLGIIDDDVSDDTLIIDGDILIYQPCCIFNDDSDQARNQIKKHINNKLDSMLAAAGCSKYIMFVTTLFNFRNDLVDDYKANRVDVERPVNLSWAKKWATAKLNTYYHKGLEADDLLGIHNKEDTIIWSLDKDLRQLPGRHLDLDNDQIIEVTEEGKLRLDKYVTESGNKKEKIYFDGTVGLYFQMLVGDTTDNIIGCGIRTEGVYKSGAKAGETYTKRKGVGAKAALKIITDAVLHRGELSVLDAALNAVKKEYYKIHKEDWQKHLETQANLLFMVRQQQGDYIRRWTYDNRKEYMNLATGKVLTIDEFKKEREDAKAV